MLEVCGKERIGLEEHHPQKRNHRLLDMLSRRNEGPGVFLEQPQETIFLFGRKMFPDQEINFRIVVVIEVGHIPRNEEGYSKEKNTEITATFHLKFFLGDFRMYNSLYNPARFLILLKKNKAGLFRFQENNENLTIIKRHLLSIQIRRYLVCLGKTVNLT